MEWRSEFASYNLGRIDGFLRANDRNLIFQEDLPGWQNARLQGLRFARTFESFARSIHQRQPRCSERAGSKEKHDRGMNSQVS
jgi:hypothetical protein